ncbi:MAG: hypothetical protein IBX62_06700 [Coriobacteriia bacterium]|nr:hypothetical protein [Coriobacteriia bacterium]
MNDRETVTTLGTLRYLHDRSAEMADAAMATLGDGEAARLVAGFRDEHARRSEELAGMLSRMGAASASPPPGFGELEREHLRLVREAGRRDEALEALLLMEEVAAAQYGLASAMELPEELASTVREHLASEQWHVSALADRIGTLPIEVAGGGVSTDHLYVDDRNPDDFDSTPEGLSHSH